MEMMEWNRHTSKGMYEEECDGSPRVRQEIELPRNQYIIYTESYYYAPEKSYVLSWYSSTLRSQRSYASPYSGGASLPHMMCISCCSRRRVTSPTSRSIVLSSTRSVEPPVVSASTKAETSISVTS